MIQERSLKRPCRRGAALPLVLMCIAFATMFATTLVKSVLLHQRHGHMIEKQHQALWLADTGVQRAKYRLRKSPRYQGEVWDIPAETLGDDEKGRVVIKVEPFHETGKSWRISVEAVYPDEPRQRVVQHRELVIADEEQEVAGPARE
ncbi:MAG: hypothetical protein ACODAD_15965 [Planctomycetota bacterium]